MLLVIIPSEVMQSLKGSQMVDATTKLTAVCPYLSEALTAGSCTYGLYINTQGEVWLTPLNTRLQ